MRITVKQGKHTVSEYRFTKGPIYIGRHANSQVFLADRAVSKHHAVLFNTEDGKWVAEDLDSANKTYLNDQAIHKANINNDDVLRIAGFTLELNLNDDADIDKPVHLEDTLTLSRGPQIIVRELDSEQSPPIRFPAGRAKDFMQAANALSQADSTDKVLLLLLNIVTKQFSACNVWCALRNKPSGPMICHGGRGRDGQAVNLENLKLNDKITQAIEKKQFLLFLFPRVSQQKPDENLRSVVIAPIIATAGCFGVIYISCALEDEHFSLCDLDYLMLLGIHTATVLERS